MNRACIVRAHGAGLFSNVNKILTCLRFYETVFVDWARAAENDPAFKYGGSYYGDAWHDLFFDNTPRPTQDFDIVYQYPTYEITDKCAGVLYEHPEWRWREAYHKAWARLECVVEPIPVGPKTVGVLIRSDALGGEQLSGKSQPLSEYKTAIDTVLSDDHRLFVVSSDQESIEYMRDRYGAKMFYSTGVKRNAKRSDPEQHLHVAQDKDDAKQVMREVLTLARCETLVSGISNMATAALIMNPNLKHVYLK